MSHRCASGHNRGVSVRERGVAVLIAGAVVAAGVWGATRLRLETDLTKFLPEGEDREAVALARAVSGSEIGRTMVVAIDAPDDEHAVRAGRALAAALRGRREVESVRAGEDPAIARAVHETYWARRFAFLSDDPARELGRRLSDRGLREAARTLKRELAGPSGAVIRTLAPEDPLLAYPAILRRLDRARPTGLREVDGAWLAGEAPPSAVLFVTTRASPFDVAAQAPLQSHLERAFARLDARSAGALAMRRAGAHRISVETQRAIQSDVTRISVLSALAVLALCAVVLGSARSVILTLVPIAVGLAAATAVSALIFPSLHAITFAFGATMIGVVEDYPTHLLQLHGFAPPGTSARESLRRAWPGLMLAGLTTAASVAALAAGGYPGMRELAVFASTGVLAALATTRWLLPPFLAPPGTTRVQRTLAAAGVSLMATLRRRRAAALVIALAALALAAFGLPRLRWSDSLTALHAPDPALVREDERVRGLVGGGGAQGRFVAALGPDDDAALATLRRVRQALEASQRHGEIGSFRSGDAWLSPAALQRANVAALAFDPRLPARLDAAFTAEGFVPGAFGPFGEAVRRAPEVEPLVWDELGRSPLGPLVRPFRIETGEGRVAWLAFADGIRDGPALARRISSIRDARWIDSAEAMRRALGAWRARALILLAVGLATVLAVAFARYRRFRLALAACLPCALAAGATLGALGVLGIEASPIHLLALLLVLGMGVDYGIFVVEHHADEAAAGASFVGIVVAGLSTVLSFGLLALSTSPALRGLGLAVGAGVLLSMLFAPVSLALVENRRGQSTVRSRVTIKSE